MYSISYGCSHPFLPQRVQAKRLRFLDLFFFGERGCKSGSVSAEVPNGWQMIQRWMLEVTEQFKSESSA